MPVLASRQLVVVTGKGGVGKTTVAAALARGLAAAEPARRFVLVEVDPRESAHRLFGVPPSGGETVAVGENLSLVNLRPDRVVDRIVRERLKLDALVERVTASPVYRHFVDGAPGLIELAILRFAFELTRPRLARRPRADCVLLDSPASGHAMSLLRAPGLVSTAIASGPVAELAREVSDWLASASTAVLLVSTAEELPVAESRETAAELERVVGRPPAALVVNALYPPVPARLAAGGVAARLWRERRALNEAQLERLAELGIGAGAELCLVPQPEGPALLAALAGGLAPLTGPPA